MAAIQFYHLTATPLERALPKLLEKAYGAGLRTLLVAESDERIDQLNQLLWTYDPGSFLPHGSLKDGQSQDQPILLATTIERANNPNLLLVTDGRTPPDAGSFERIIDIFDGANEQTIANARARWANYKEAGHQLAYLRQTENGGWDKTA